jgi:nucleoside 2-deoxyribosyltransferase
MQEPLKVEHSMQFPGEVPDSEALMLPVLSMTKDGKQHRVSDVRQWVGDLLRLPAEARAELLPSGGESLFSNRVRWAIQYLKWAGALKAIEHSVYQITDRGQSLLEESPNGITAKTLRRFREFAEPLQGDSATNGRCCVFQPFDGKGPFDKRYDDTIAPAIKASGLQAYRVDRDDGVVIPFETLHEQIRSATMCLAGISSQDPNVMYELGFAIACDKNIVLICSTQQTQRFPFDIQHRRIVQYASDSASDFEKLRNDIVHSIHALLDTRQKAALEPFE